MHSLRTYSVSTPALSSAESELQTERFGSSALRVSGIEESIPWEAIKSHASIFNPRDPWAIATRAGILSTPNWEGLRVAEVGIGSGVTTGVLLREHPEIHVLFGTDLNEHALPVTAQNIEVLAPESAGKFRGIPGSHDLLSGLLSSDHIDQEKTETKLDRIFACIPQMLVPEDGYTPPPDALAHYLRADDATGVLSIDAHGLALNARLLQQARTGLKPDGDVLLTISGRPPADVVIAMFEKYGFAEPTVRHRALIEQDPGTSIEQLARLERRFSAEGVRFEFWGADDLIADSTPPLVHSRRRPMSACEAKAVLTAGGKIYHHLYVLESSLIAGEQTEE
jgi:SAM-dependent methyltransferase